MADRHDGVRGLPVLLLSGYSAEARARADALDVPLFVLEPSGAARPENAAAVALDAEAS